MKVRKYFISVFFVNKAPRNWLIIVSLPSSRRWQRECILVAHHVIDLNKLSE